MKIIDPEKDGIDHINIYSKAKTELGRWLSNFQYCPINTYFHGKFNSIEGFWYYLGTDHPDKEKLRNLYGFQAKKIGKEMKKVSKVHCDNFEDRIREALQVKIGAMPNHLEELFYCSDLPLEHYYNYSGKIIDVKDCKWILEFLEELRHE
jgi:hypothetical protein